MQFILEGVDFMSLSEGDLKKSSVFNLVTDNPKNPEHHYLEAYLHALWASQTKAVVGLSPRDLSTTVEKNPVPGTLMAFFQALRNVNSALLEDLATKLEATELDEAKHICGLIRNGSAFTDVAVQIHYGTKDIGAQHNDALNSVLHCALTLHGERHLTLGNKKAKPKPDTVTLVGGAVYITSPAFFKHHVMYPACKYPERIVSIQARLSLTEQTLSTLEACDENVMTPIADVIKNCLAERKMVLPTLEQVKQVMDGAS
jgi:hypothetical protein